MREYRRESDVIKGMKLGCGLLIVTGLAGTLLLAGWIVLRMWVAANVSAM